MAQMVIDTIRPSTDQTFRSIPPPFSTRHSAFGSVGRAVFEHSRHKPRRCWEMADPWGQPSEVVGKLSADPEMTRRFGEAYRHGPDRASLLDAIATYER